ncbi:E3 ubiquitin-protein ligase TRIM21-like isoform X2 [Dendrobates tinctorius]|uniref:E3 ubiquitin-protein ligase TRIM21-like isoform X2 n=1 Tax=Dendrobates tinctorius TaxID=92724 RepID=UPI003CC96FBF
MNDTSLWRAFLTGASRANQQRRQRACRSDFSHVKMSSFSDLEDELRCPICLCMYTEPVTLRCGHNFCNWCIRQALDSQVSYGTRFYHYCPYCRKRFAMRPNTHPNIALRNIVNRLQSFSPETSIVGIPCTYCITAPVSAAMYCLLCEALLCNDHIAVHNKSPEHVLVASTLFSETRKCFIHSKLLDYFSPEDVTCVYCTAHRNNQTQEHGGPSESTNLKEVLEKLTLKREVIANCAENHLLHKRKMQTLADNFALGTKALFANLKRNLSSLEIRILKETRRQEEQVSFSVDDCIKRLEVRQNEISKQIACVQEISNFPIPKPEIAGQGHIEAEGTNRENVILLDEFRVDHFIPVLISETLRRELHDIVANVKPPYRGNSAIDILLDAGTAGRSITVSEDQKTASCSIMKRKRTKNPQTQVNYQVLSTQSFSGRYYWEVETCDNRSWRIGVVYPSIGKKKPTSRIGDDKKSWCLCCFHQEYSVRHGGRKIDLSQKVSALRLGVYLDSKAGTLSFFELGDPIVKLYTFTTTFSGPVHAVLYLGGIGWLKIGLPTRSLPIFADQLGNKMCD